METNNSEKRTIEIYSDGGAWPNNGTGNGGWACIIKNGESITELSGNCEKTTNNRMELEAILQALNFIKLNYVANDPIVIYSDSQWAINACNGNWHITKNLDKVKEIKWIYQTYMMDIEWKWVKSHSGNTFNERCDVLASAEMKKLTKNE